VIRRELLVQEGQLMDSSLLEKSQRDVFNLGLFDDVKIALTEGAEPNTVDLDIEVVERSTGSFNFGGGWSSVDNFVLSGGVSYANVFGLAHQINFSATLGSISQTFNLNYTMPRFLDTHYLMGIDAYKTEREYIIFQPPWGVSPKPLISITPCQDS
jgi:outer membrane protein insertion porin family